MNNIVYAGKHSLTKRVSKHSHVNTEIIYCTGGKGVLRFDEISLQYKSGDIIVIPPYIPHSNFSEEGFTNYHINVSQCGITQSKPFILERQENSYILDSFAGAFFFYSSNIIEKAAILSAYGTLISTYINTYSKLASSAGSDIVRDIESNIICHFTECDYDLSAYLHTLPFSYDYLIKLFKTDFGMTPHKYLTELRLKTAADWLTGSESSNVAISEVSIICGIKEPLYFSRLFKKKYGVSPSMFSKQSVSGNLLDENTFQVRRE